MKEIIGVDLPFPRDQIRTKELPEFTHLRGRVYRLIKREQEDETEADEPVLEAVRELARGSCSFEREVEHEHSGTRPSCTRLVLASVAGAIVALAVFGGTAASAPVQTSQGRDPADRQRVPAGHRHPEGSSQQGIEIKKTTLQSGNDVVLAMANNNGDIGYLGFVPMFIAVTNNIPMTLVAASEVEGVGQADNWQNILVKGNSSIRTSRDLAGKTIAVNALKGVGEVMIKAALEKQGVRPNSFRLTAIPFPQMRSALNNGQVDAIWVPEPFLSQGLNIDNARIVMAPGPVLGRYWPIGGYAARQSWRSRNPALAERFRKAINRSLTYAQSHPDEVRAMLPANAQNSRLPIWSPVIDRGKLASSPPMRGSTA